MGKALSHGIGLRLLVLIVLFSTLVTAISTVIQLYLDYRRDVGAIEGRLDEIERSSLASLAGSLWHVDVDQLRRQVEGLIRLPDMQAVEVREAEGAARPLVVAVRLREGGPVLARDLPLVYNDRGTERLIGHLHAEATLTGVYSRLIETAVVILVSQGIKTFLVSLFTLYIVYRLVARHLVDIAGYAQRFDIKDPAPPLALRRRHPGRPDELDQVVSAFNAMRMDLQSAWEQLRTANAELEDDIVRREAHEREMRRLVDRLTRTNAELERFATISSHDLQEPLRAITSYAQLIEKRYGDHLDDEGREFLGYMTGGALRMKALVNDLATYARIPGHFEPPRPVELGAVCAGVLAGMKDAIEAADAEIVVGTLPVVEGDPERLAHLFRNLLDNAIKFRHQDVAPRVSVTAEPDPGGGWVVSVADNGIGIGATNQDVFEIFRRLHPASAYPGTGVGLAICRRIVEHMGGRIWLDSRPGQGTTIRFTVGVPPEAAAE
ncbi:ATP-binding protein [Magnetospirillum sp. UT-4]|uniref:sensor histidine kinase n=1 Tax=Magnetospirillum sp. UT-4 TaxID=2681467 RepID=UPI001571D2A7|nr:ATP-binding protein [Magnetospirillum sp. UT-4]